MDRIVVYVKTAESKDARVILELVYDNMWDRMINGKLECDEADLDLFLPTRNIDQLKAQLATGEPLYRIAILAGTIVGVYALRDQLEEKRSQFRSFYVHHNWQQRGIGHQLFDDALAMARRVRPENVGLFLHTARANTDAQSIYQKWDFRLLGPEHSQRQKVGRTEIEWVRMDYNF